MIKRLTLELQTGEYYIVRVPSEYRHLKESMGIKWDYFSYFIGKKYIWHSKEDEFYYFKTAWKSKFSLLEYLMGYIKQVEVYEADTREEVSKFMKNFCLSEKLTK